MSVFGSHGRVRSEQFSTGDVGYVPQGYGHYIENAGSEDLEKRRRPGGDAWNLKGTSPSSQSQFAHRAGLPGQQSTLKACFDQMGAL
jgi:hypothetical protein